MKRNPIETILGFLVLISTGVFVFLVMTHVDVRPVTGYQVKANFLKTGGLEVGADVRISGVKVGSVLSAKLNENDYTADVILSIDPTIKLPKDTQATIADAGLMGSKYVRLVPGGERLWLKDGDQITKTKDYKSLEDSVSDFIFLSTN